MIPLLIGLLIGIAVSTVIAYVTAEPISDETAATGGSFDKHAEEALRMIAEMPRP